MSPYDVTKGHRYTSKQQTGVGSALSGCPLLVSFQTCRRCSRFSVKSLHYPRLLLFRIKNIILCSIQKKTPPTFHPRFPSSSASAGWRPDRSPPCPPAPSQWPWPGAPAARWPRCPTWCRSPSWAGSGRTLRSRRGPRRGPTSGAATTAWRWWAGPAASGCGVSSGRGWGTRLEWLQKNRRRKKKKISISEATFRSVIRECKQPRENSKFYWNFDLSDWWRLIRFNELRTKFLWFRTVQGGFWLPWVV